MKTFSIKQIKEPEIRIEQATSVPIQNILRYNGRNRDRVLDFDVMLSNGQPLQRPLVWSLIQKQSLILSILKDKNIQPIIAIIGGKNDDNYKIIDGKQRLTTIQSFLDNEFPIIFDNEEYYFNDFDDASKCSLIHKNILVSGIYERIVKGIKYDTVPYTDEELVNLFDYINYSGTPQDADHIVNLKKSLNK